MTKDISTREDLFIIVNDFYSDLLESKELSHFFEAFKNEEALEHHLNTLVDFWDNTLFYSGTYQRNAMKPHLRINRKKGMAVSDFDLWLKLFSKAVDHNFKGQNAEAIKNKALSIATVMKLKMNIY
jgi:hemoglobin